MVFGSLVPDQYCNLDSDLAHAIGDREVVWVDPLEAVHYEYEFEKDSDS